MLSEFLEFQANVQLYHWRTHSHSRHEAAGELYEDMTKLIDEYMEVCMGKSHRRVALKKDTLNVKMYTHASIVTYLRGFLSFLENGLTTKDTSLLNIRDEMRATILRTLYKFSQR
jgi:hypothetical protein